MSDTSSSSDDSEWSIPDEFPDEYFDEEGIKPYLFEPEMSSSSDEEMTDESVDSLQESNRLQNSGWCTCGNCQTMDRADECVCCKEVHKVSNICQLSDENDIEVNCITEHPGFRPVCTNKYVLQTAWKQYKQQYSASYEGPEHKMFRHIAYRQLARWCWGYLGKEVRVVLPSCAVMCIRQHFPPPGLEDNFVFEGFHYADE